MLNLLIVDDEPFVVDWIYSLLEERMPNLELFKAYSAIQAMSILERIRISIVVCDIRMPRMSGIELLEHLVQKWPRCRVVFLTGYSEFDYVYYAIKNRGVRYLLKTESDDTIVECLRSVVKEIDEEKKVQSISTELFERASNLMLCDRFVHAILDGKRLDLSLISKLGFKIDVPLYLVFGWFAENDVSIDHAFRCEAAFEHCVGFRFNIMQCSLGVGTYLWLLQPKQSNQEDNSIILSGHLDEIQSILCDNDAHVRFYWKEQPIIPNMIANELAKFVYEANCRNIPDNAIISDATVEIGNNSNIMAALSVIDLKKRISKTQDLRQALLSGNVALYEELHNNIVLDLASVKNRYDYACTQVFSSIALVLMGYIFEHAQNELMSTEQNLTSLRSPDNFHSWKDAFDYLLMVGKMCIQLSQLDKDDQQKNAIKQLLDYIDKHLKDDLSLASLAEILHYNPCYLSNVFRKETGTNLTAYINNARIQKACYLLTATNERISEIAEQCGFTSVQYFNTVFHKITNTSPKTYREKPAKKVERNENTRSN